jgi:heterodisulfide reductase subunit A-like polyferredoxin
MTFLGIVRRGEVMTKTSAVLMIGEGIAGVQASLDLAESGFKGLPRRKNSKYRRANGTAG